MYTKHNLAADIEALLAGKILASNVGGEYGLFIKMEDDND